MAPAQNGPASKKDLGGDDLGTMDEVRVFKDEGEIEEEDASESLHADLLEDEAGLDRVPGSSKTRDGKSVTDPASAYKNPLAIGYPNPYLAGGYPRPYLLAHMGHPLAAAASNLDSAGTPAGSPADDAALLPPASHPRYGEVWHSQLSRAT